MVRVRVLRQRERTVCFCERGLEKDFDDRTSDDGSFDGMPSPGSLGLGDLKSGSHWENICEQATGAVRTILASGDMFLLTR
jgi:hypothetical protein